MSTDTTSTFYQASPIKRDRSTKAEVEARRAALYAIIATMRPMTVRQVFYQATVRDIVEKTEAGYNKVQTDLDADAPRRRRCPMTGSPTTPAGSASRAPSTASRRRSRTPRGSIARALWADADAYVEVWLEKDALAGVILPITVACTTCR